MKTSLTLLGAAVCGLGALQCEAAKLEGPTSGSDHGSRENYSGTATLQEEIATVTTLVFQDQFTNLQATKDKNRLAGRKYSFQVGFTANGEAEKYTDTTCNNADTTYNMTAGVDGTVDATNWNYCIQSDAGGNGANSEDGKYLRIRAFELGTEPNSSVYSGRINSKRTMEFKPTSTQGMRVDMRLRTEANFPRGYWPAGWFLQRRINEGPVIGDGDNAPWPCGGAMEIDLFEKGWVWNDTYLKSSMHKGNLANCIAQQPAGSYGFDSTVPSGTGHDDGGWHVYTLELETGESRFFIDGTQYGPTQTLSGESQWTDDGWFAIFNLAVGGALGYPGYNPNAGGFDEFRTARFFDIDYWKVFSFDPATNGAGGAPPPTGPRQISARLEADKTTNDGYYNVGSIGGDAGFEACSDEGGGQNMGWIDSGDWIEWSVNFPSSGNYTANIRHGGTGTSTVDLLVAGTEVISNFSLPSTGSWTTFTGHTTGSFYTTAGTKTFRMRSDGTGQNWNWVKIDPATSPTCTDGIQNQGEAGVDCGGPCVNSCSGNAGIKAGTRVEAETEAVASGTTEEAGPPIAHGYWDTNDYIEFTNADLRAIGAIKVRYAVDNASAGRTIQFRDQTSNITLGSWNVTGTGGWATWAEQTINLPVETSAASSTFRITCTAGGTGCWNLDWFELIAKSQDGGGGNGAGCTNGVQDGNEGGVDCGGSCAACTAAVRLEENSGATCYNSSGAVVGCSTESGGTSGTKTFLKDANEKICWSGVNLTGKTNLRTFFANAEGMTDTMIFTTNGVNATSQFSVTQTNGWSHPYFTMSGGQSIPTGNRTTGQTVCIKVSSYTAPGWVSAVDYVEAY